MILENPVLTTNRIVEELDVTPQSALNHVRRLESEEIVIEVVGIPGRSKRWVAPDVLRALGADDEPFTVQLHALTERDARDAFGQNDPVRAAAPAADDRTTVGARDRGFAP